MFIPERRGHGHTPDVDGPITYQLMTDDTIAFLEHVVDEPADLVGHIDGAFVAMQVGMQRPDLVNRIVLNFRTLDPGADGGRHPAPQTGPANWSTEAAAQR